MFLEQRINDMYKYLGNGNVVLTEEQELHLNVYVSKARKTKGSELAPLSQPSGILKNLLEGFKIFKKNLL